MFGKEYANHLDILTKSFGEINSQYEKKIKGEKKNTLIESLKKIYIKTFGIPEIGFQIRSMYFKSILSSRILHKQPKKILDAGSGIGTYTFWLATNFPSAKVTGGDIDKNKLHTSDILKRSLHKNNVSFTYLNILTKQSASIFDLITIVDVLEHIENYDLVLRNLYTSLQKEGYLYIHVPQSNQKRIFPMLRSWHHEDHAHEGINKETLVKTLEEIGFTILVERETFGFFGKFSWELNHITLPRSFILAGIIFPILYLIAKIDTLFKNKNGLGIAVLAEKK